jgi:hypothetical protein
VSHDERRDTANNDRPCAVDLDENAAKDRGGGKSPKKLAKPEASQMGLALAYGGRGRGGGVGNGFSHGIVRRVIIARGDAEGNQGVYVVVEPFFRT